jgi:hypothetical protein
MISIYYSTGIENLKNPDEAVEEPDERGAQQRAEAEQQKKLRGR